MANGKVDPLLELLEGFETDIRDEDRSGKTIGTAHEIGVGEGDVVATGATPDIDG